MASSDALYNNPVHLSHVFQEFAVFYSVARLKNKQTKTKQHSSFSTERCEPKKKKDLWEGKQKTCRGFQPIKERYTCPVTVGC